MTDDMVRCSACGTPHGSIEDATVCCEKDKPGVVGPRTVKQLRSDIRRYQHNIDMNEEKLKIAQDELFVLDPDIGMASIARSFLRSVCGKDAFEGDDE